jgi:hypothetical protein
MSSDATYRIAATLSASSIAASSSSRRTTSSASTSSDCSRVIAKASRAVCMRAWAERATSASSSADPRASRAPLWAACAALTPDTRIGCCQPASVSSRSELPRTYPPPVNPGMGPVSGTGPSSPSPSPSGIGGRSGTETGGSVVAVSTGIVVGAFGSTVVVGPATEVGGVVVGGASVVVVVSATVVVVVESGGGDASARPGFGVARATVTTAATAARGSQRPCTTSSHRRPRR